MAGQPMDLFDEEVTFITYIHSKCAFVLRHMKRKPCEHSKGKETSLLVC